MPATADLRGGRAASGEQPAVSGCSPGYFGDFGGRYVPEVLIPALDDLPAGLSGRQGQFAQLLATFAGRSTPLTFAGRPAQMLGGARIYLKNEEFYAFLRTEGERHGQQD